MFANKKLGQNFLIDKNKINDIVSAIEIPRQDTLVVEVGPGLGALTIPLSKKTKNLIAIEIDPNLSKELKKSLPDLRLVTDDVLKVNLNQISQMGAVFVSNLPYYISTKILFQAMGNPNFISINVMLQKELVDRIISDVGSRDYGRLAVSIWSFFEVERVIPVSKGCFKPKPNVDSKFIKLTRTKRPIEEREEYLQFIKDSFHTKRKTWLNSLKESNSPYYQKIEKWINENNIPSSARAEQISVDQFKWIWKEWIMKPEEEEK